MARQVSVAIAGGLTPVPVLHHPCLTVSAASLTLSVGCGTAELSATQLDLVGHARAPDACPGG